MLKYYKMARQRKVSHRDGTVTSFGNRGTEKGGGKGGKAKRNDTNNFKEKSGKSPPKREVMPKINLAIYEIV